jgi:nicotinate-nucleotide adenylyltransferase
MRIGLFGGSFNPPHAGHVHASEVALHRLGLDRVWWIVSPGNPLKRNPPAPFEERMRAAEELVTDPRIVVSDLEARLGTPYSWTTIRYLKRRMAGVKLVWIVGADILATFHHWRDWRRIAMALPLAVVDRPGSALAATVSPVATLLRGRRLPESEAWILPERPPPCWVFLHTRLNPASSTQLRAAEERAGGHVLKASP